MAVRRRLLATLFGGSALGTIAFILAVTITAIVAEDITGSARWSGIPAAVATLGAAVGASALSSVMARSGRRAGLVRGVVLAAIGAIILTGATVISSFAVLNVGAFALGFGRAAYQLARYAAADLQPPNRRATAISWLVWAGTIGSVVGPQLLSPSERLGDAWFETGLAGPYLVAAVVFGLAGMAWYLLLRPDPSDVAHPQAAEVSPAAITAGAPELRRRPNVWVAATSMWLGQYAMVQVMAMTPVFLAGRGETLAVVGGVISIHTLGMFALSPATGWLTGKIGPRRVISGGVGLLLTSVVLGYAGSLGDLTYLYPALFLLGLGWNFTFVAGSSLLLEGLAPGEGIALQGWADSGVWISGGVANIAAGIILDASSFAALNVVAGSVALIPMLALGWERRLRRVAV